MIRSSRYGVASLSEYASAMIAVDDPCFEVLATCSIDVSDCTASAQKLLLA